MASQLGEESLEAGRRPSRDPGFLASDLAEQMASGLKTKQKCVCTTGCRSRSRRKTPGTSTVASLKGCLPRLTAQVLDLGARRSQEQSQAQGRRLQVHLAQGTLAVRRKWALSRSASPGPPLSSADIP